MGVYKMISEEQGKKLLRLSRQLIENYVNRKETKIPKEYSEEFNENIGVFCSIYLDKELRGCIGIPYPEMSLIDALMEASLSATQDPRFPPLNVNELKKVIIELSFLSKPEKIDFSSPKELLDKIEKGKDGLIIERGSHKGLFLPQVWEQIPDKEEFMENLCIKANLPPGTWKLSETVVKKFKVQTFSE